MPVKEMARRGWLKATPEQLKRHAGDLARAVVCQRGDSRSRPRCSARHATRGPRARWIATR